MCLVIECCLFSREKRISNPWCVDSTERKFWLRGDDGVEDKAWFAHEQRGFIVERLSWLKEMTVRNII